MIYRLALHFLCRSDEGREESEGSEAARLTRLRRQRMRTEGLVPLRKAWWHQMQLEPRVNMWRYALMLEVVEGWNLAEKLRRTVPGRPASVLVVQLEHLGNMIHTIPLLRLLRKELPETRIDLMVGPWGEELARSIRLVDTVITYCPAILQMHRGTSRRCLAWREELAFLRDLRERTYDLLICCGAGNLWERLLVQAIRPALWVGCRAAGDPYPEWGTALTTDYGIRLREARRLLDLARLAGLDTVGETEPVLCLDAEAINYGKAVIEELKQERSLSQVAVFAPGAGWPGKVWPAERYAALAAALRARGVRSVVVGGEDARDAGRRISAAADGIQDLTGRTTLMECAGIIAAADIFVGSDSGLLHIAAAVETPTIGLYGPVDPRQWAPRGPRHLALRRLVSCRGCLPWHPRNRCGDRYACMRAITVEEVLAAAVALLGSREAA